MDKGKDGVGVEELAVLGRETFAEVLEDSDGYGHLQLSRRVEIAWDKAASAIKAAVEGPLLEEMKELQTDVNMWKATAVDQRVRAEKAERELAQRPTEWAYEQVCKARTNWQDRAEAAEAEVERLKTRQSEIMDEMDEMYSTKIVSTQADLKAAQEEVGTLTRSLANTTEENERLKEHGRFRRYKVWIDNHMAQLERLEEERDQYKESAEAAQEREARLETENDALKLVYEAAKGLSSGYDWNRGTHAGIYRAQLINAVDAVAELREALARPAGEPVEEVER